MSLRLTLMRHAKSDWGDPGLPDHDRPLNARGHHAAETVGAWMAEAGIAPARVLLSTARRVEETWAGLEAHLPGVHVARSETLYHAAPETILDHVSGQDCSDVMVIAHNPGMAALAQYLVNETPDRSAFHRYPTGALLVLDIAGDDWNALGPACGRVAHFLVPRDLTD